jgi:hypothetical protein
MGLAFLSQRSKIGGWRVLERESSRGATTGKKKAGVLVHPSPIWPDHPLLARVLADRAGDKVTR